MVSLCHNKEREEKNMALGLLLLLFIGMSVVSGLGILFLFLIKDHKKRKPVFYFLVVWGMFIAFLSATSLPTNFIMQQVIAWAIGFVSIIALLVYLRAKTERQYYISYILVSCSVVIGILRLFYLI